MALDVDRTAAEFEAQLRALGTPERAEGEKRYLRSDLEHLGATVWENRRAVKAFVSQHPDLSREDLLALARGLWSRQVFDRRLATALVLEACSELLEPADLALLLELIRDSHTWALVDVLAGDVTGALIVRHPEAASQIDSWAYDGDFWVRRAALLSCLEPHRHGHEFERFARYADTMLDEREFFIRKAIGWVLREAGKRDPDEVYRWLAPRIDRASGVTVREAVKYPNGGQREELLEALKRRRRPARDASAAT